MQVNPQKMRRALGTLMLAAMLSFTMGTAEPDKPNRGKRGPDNAPKVGADAPNFKLKRNKDESKEVELASFKGKKPVVLIFGSYT